MDDDGDFVADYYTGAPSAAELTDSVAARIYILARSVSEVPNYNNDKTYRLGAKIVPPANDGFYRRVFSTTVLLHDNIDSRYNCRTSPKPAWQRFASGTDLSTYFDAGCDHHHEDQYSGTQNGW